MALKHVISLRDLGKDGAWLLLQQVCGIAEAGRRSSFMEGRTAVLFFLQDSFADRLCITAAIHQMGGDVVYMDSEAWARVLKDFPLELPSLVSSYLDCAFVYGVPLRPLYEALPSANVPVINAGSPEGSPYTVLADLACIYKRTEDFSAVTLAWLGCANGLLYSLLEAMEYFPYALRICAPQDGGIDLHLVRQAQAAGHAVQICDGPEAALQGANYVYAGCRGDLVETDAQGYALDAARLGMAATGARLLFSCAPIHSVPVARELMQGRISLMRRQAENRLCVMKRLLHWVFSEE